MEVPIAPDIPSPEDTKSHSNPAFDLVSQLQTVNTERAPAEGTAPLSEELDLDKAFAEAEEIAAAVRSEAYVPQATVPHAMRPTAAFGAPSTGLAGVNSWATAPPDLGTLGAAPKPDPSAAAPSPFVLQPDGSIVDARDLL